MDDLFTQNVIAAKTTTQGFVFENHTNLLVFFVFFIKPQILIFTKNFKALTEICIVGVFFFTASHNWNFSKPMHTHTHTHE